MNEKKNGSNFLKSVVACVLIFLLIFTSVVLYLFYKTGGMEPSTLVAAVFGATVSELSICGWIQKHKIQASKDATDTDAENGEDDRG